MPPGCLTRRAALGLLGCLPLRPALAVDDATDADEPVFLSAYGTRDGRFGVAALGADGRISLMLPLPERGHGAVVRPDARQAVMIARRPGTFAMVFDLPSGRQSDMLQAASGRHFYGHGAYSPDGRLFYATENDIDGERGVVGVYDVAGDYDRVGEFDSFGIGPHELVLLPDGKTLAVANGGILTHPDLPRVKLNLPDMQPSVAFIDRVSGELLGQWRPPTDLHQLSLRHLAVNRDGLLAVVAQWEGAETETPPLVGLGNLGEDMRLISAPAPVQIAMRHYCGSVAFDRSGRTFAVSAPRGDTITYWHADGRFDRSEALVDGCGLARQRDGFLRTSGLGVVRTPDGLESRAPLAWDNHITAAPDR